MSDGSVKISTKIDNSQLDKGLKETDKILGGLGNKFKLSSVAAAGFAGAAALGVGKVVSVMNDCAAAYRVQEKAEKALEAAAKNNPYLNDESVYNLKQFASELQKTSEIGDEVSISLMGQLANAGRTEEEIRQIMQVSADMAASGAFTIDGAVKNLNKTFSGLSGELGEVVPELKNLTAEEMQNGKAIDVLKSKYKGMAEGTAQTTVQLANSFGDLKENIGAGWDKSLEPARKWLIDVINKANEVLSKNKQLADIASNKKTTTEQKLTGMSEKDKKKFINDYAFLYSSLNSVAPEGLERIKQQFDYIAEKTGFSVDLIIELGKEYDQLSPIVQKYVDQIQIEAKVREETARAEIKANEERAKADSDEKARIAAQNAKNEKAQEYLKTYEESLAKQIESIKLKAQLEGRSIESAAVQQEILNVQIGAYMALIESSEGLITGNTEREKEKTKAIEAQTQAVKNLTEAEGQRQKSLDDAIQATEEVQSLLEQQPVNIKPEVKIQLDIDAVKEEAVKLRTELRLINDEELAAIGMTNDERMALIDNVTEKELELTEALEEEKKKLLTDRVNEATKTDQTETEAYKAHIDELLSLRQEVANSEILTEKEKARKIKEIDEAIAAAQTESISSRISKLNEYMQQANSIAQNIKDFAVKQIDTEEKLRIAQVENSIMSEDEKAKAIEEIQYEAAQKRYKAEMFAWSASLLAATANIALGITEAVKLGYAGIPLGVIVAASGALQIASIIASKPKPPTKGYASGGIVPGSSYSGDRVHANVNSGEMILNAAQQRALWETANGHTGANGTNIVINNSAANIVSAQPNISKNQIEIMIDARVKASMSKGRYTDSFRQMQGGMNGTAYTI